MKEKVKKEKNPDVMNIKELCYYLGCGETTARTLVRNKDIPYYKTNGKYLFEKSAIDWWISNQYKKEGFSYEVK